MSRGNRLPVILVFASALLFIAGISAAERLSPDVAKALNSIQPFDAYSITKQLASREFAGRLTGHEGYTAAARWAADRFRSWGLKPYSRDAGYLQAYHSPYVLVDHAEMMLYLPDQSEGAKEPVMKEMRLQPEKDFLPLLFSASGDHTAETVFAGWGISAPELGYDDYAGIEAKGKFVLCFRGTPDPADRRYEEHDHHRRRMQTAKDRGALGIIYIYDEIASNPNGEWIEGFTPAEVSSHIGDLILKDKSLTAADLRKDLTTYKKPISFPLQVKVRLKVEARHFPDAIGYNVVGIAAGSGSALRQECLVVGGHFDHNGLHMGLFFPGADDNASGSAVVMEIAEAFSRLARKPKRSVVFVLFGGEEKGLMGSSYFSENLPPGLTRVDTMFNFDMVGEGDRAGVGYSAFSPELKSLLEEADSHVQTLAGSRPIHGVGVRGSDHAPFFQKGIPCVSFHSNGPHLYYHQTGDTIYRINPDIMADIARLAFLAAFSRADRADKSSAE